jgi:catechol 2,3-dioxygenase-like lactoylglutathione lyase family enzyme
LVEVERVDFVSIPTRDLERAKQFYGGLLGLPSHSYSPDDFETSNVTLELWEPEKQGEPFEPNRNGIALRVPDVAAARAELEAARVEFLGETRDSGVCHMAFCYDPDGNVLILHNRYAPFE